jgi:hypothetical protein
MTANQLSSTESKASIRPAMLLFAVPSTAIAGHVNAEERAASPSLKRGDKRPRHEREK